MSIQSYFYHACPLKALTGKTAHNYTQCVPPCRRLSPLELFLCFPAIMCKVQQKQVVCQTRPDQGPTDISHTTALKNLKPEITVKPVTWSQGDPEQHYAREVFAFQEAASFIQARILSGSPSGRMQETKLFFFRRQHFHRITVGDLVQPPSSSRVILDPHGTGLCPNGS